MKELYHFLRIVYIDKGYILLLYLIGINFAACFVMWTDKRKAKKHRRRIPERMLFLFPLLGGSIGGLVGMYAFHHKTRHWYFRFGFPLILAAQAALAFCAFYFLR